MFFRIKTFVTTIAETTALNQHHRTVLDCTTL